MTDEQDPEEADEEVEGPTRKVAAMTNLVAELLVHEQERATPVATELPEDTGAHADRAALDVARLITVADSPPEPPRSAVEPEAPSLARGFAFGVAFVIALVALGAIVAYGC
jgi:hypothetical protein